MIFLNRHARLTVFLFLLCCLSRGGDELEVSIAEPTKISIDINGDFVYRLPPPWTGSHINIVVTNVTPNELIIPFYALLVELIIADSDGTSPFRVKMLPRFTGHRETYAISLNSHESFVMPFYTNDLDLPQRWPGFPEGRISVQAVLKVVNFGAFKKLPPGKLWTGSVVSNPQIFRVITWTAKPENHPSARVDEYDQTIQSRIPFNRTTIAEFICDEVSLDGVINHFIDRIRETENKKMSVVYKLSSEYRAKMPFISLNLKNTNINEILEKACDAVGVNYTIEDDIICIDYKKNPLPAADSLSESQVDRGLPWRGCRGLPP